jgi:Rieske Fe-S protein
MNLMDSTPNSTTPQATTRRGFLYWITAALGAVAAVVFVIPFMGYLLGVRARKVAWVSLGEADHFPVGDTRMVTFDNPLKAPWDGMAAHTGVYVRREPSGDGEQPKFLVLAVNCAHLGCPVSWFPQSGLFMCPCHGGVYYENGDRASGPPPRGMFHCTWRVRRGQLEVQAPHYPSLQDTLDQPAREAQA